MANPVILPMNHPIDFNVIRQVLVQAVRTTTGLTMIEEMPETQVALRPDKPYFSYTITTPAAKFGDDDSRFISDNGVQVLFNRGGNRRMSVSFHCYTVNKDDAYNFMSLWQSSLETEGVQATLIKSGIAVWLNGTVADNSQLLNTGYEGRSQMDVQFGISFNITENLGAIEEVQSVGTIKDDSGLVIENNLPVEAQGE